MYFLRRFEFYDQRIEWFRWLFTVPDDKTVMNVKHHYFILDHGTIPALLPLPRNSLPMRAIHIMYVLVEMHGY